MGFRNFKQSKAKAALALVNPANSVLPIDAEARISALEAIDHPHSNLAQLDKVSGFGSWNYFSDGVGASLVKKTSTYSITTQDSIVLCDATTSSFTVTLPNPSLCYDGVYLASIVYNISKIDSSSHTVTIAPYAGETIAGDTSFVLVAQNEVITLCTDGINWFLKD